MRNVTSTFNIFEHGRTTHNNRPYLLAAVKRIIDSPKVQEALKLGELYGYYGHGKRELAEKLTPSEIEVVMVKGKPVAIEQVPSNVTVELNVDDDGNVTHTQRILDTNTGLIVDAMESSGTGGWSWATSGTANNFVGFGGFDYVKRPSYISNDKRTKLMLESIGVESVEECIIHNLKGGGLSQEESQLILESWEEKEEDNAVEQSLKLQCLMFESVIQDQEQSHKQVVGELKAQIDDVNQWRESRKTLMLESLNTLPIIPTDEQKEAFLNLSSEEDLKIVSNMFESVQEQLMTLPSGLTNSLDIQVNGSKEVDGELSNNTFINLSGEEPANPYTK